MVAVKCSSWAKIRKNRGRHLEDPLKGESISNRNRTLEMCDVDQYSDMQFPFASRSQKPHAYSWLETIIQTSSVAWRCSKMTTTSTQSCPIALVVTFARSFGSQVFVSEGLPPIRRRAKRPLRLHARTTSLWTLQSLQPRSFLPLMKCRHDLGFDNFWKDSITYRKKVFVTAT